MSVKLLLHENKCYLTIRSFELCRLLPLGDFIGRRPLNTWESEGKMLPRMLSNARGSAPIALSIAL